MRSIESYKKDRYPEEARVPKKKKAKKVVLKPCVECGEPVKEQSKPEDHKDTCYFFGEMADLDPDWDKKNPEEAKAFDRGYKHGLEAERKRTRKELQNLRSMLENWRGNQESSIAMIDQGIQICASRQTLNGRIDGLTWALDQLIDLIPKNDTGPRARVKLLAKRSRKS